MNRENICKFITSMPTEILRVRNFIFETNTDTMMSARTLDSNRVFLIVSGCVNFRFGNTEARCERGDLVFAFCGEHTSAEVFDDAQYMYISFEGDRADELFRRFGISKQRRVFRANEGLIPVWRDSLFRCSENAIDLAAESSLLFAVSRLAAESSSMDNVLKKALAIIENNFSDPDINLGAVASELGYNSKYFSHHFKKCMGVGFAEYLRNLRINRAVFLFDHGIESVKNVAYLSGFCDPLYFSSTFKAILGVTPKQYKNAKKNQASGTLDQDS